MRLLVVGGVVSAALVGAVYAGTNDDAEELRVTTARPPATEPFTLAATRGCLRSRGAEVSEIVPADSRLRALRDLAQQTSLGVRLGGRVVGLAFGDATLLERLLRVPDDPYRLEPRRNALLMFLPSARGQAEVVRGCLRS